jgi:hypothetical protein
MATGEMFMADTSHCSTLIIFTYCFNVGGEMTTGQTNKEDGKKISEEGEEINT